MAATARWQVVYDHLLTGIDQGEYPPDHQLPTERELMRQFGYARDTVRRAYAQLEQKGLVVVGGPTGRRVRQPVELYFDASKFERIYTDDPDLNRDQWSQDVAAQGWEHDQTPVVNHLPATRCVARWLDVDLKTPLIRRRRLRRVRQTPAQPWKTVVIADSWFPLDIAHRQVDGLAPLLMQQNITMRGGIIRSLGIRQEMFVDEIRARMPHDDETELLDLLPYTPVLEFARVGIDDAGRRIRVIVNVLSSDSQYLKYILDVPQPQEPSPATEDM